MAKKKKKKTDPAHVQDEMNLDTLAESWNRDVLGAKAESDGSDSDGADEEETSEEGTDADLGGEEAETGEGEQAEEEEGEEAEEEEAEEEAEEGEGEEAEQEEEAGEEGEGEYATEIRYVANRQEKVLQLESKLTKRDVDKIAQSLSLAEGLDSRLKQARDSENRLRTEVATLGQQHQELSEAVGMQSELDKPIIAFLQAVRFDPRVRQAMAGSDWMLPTLKAYGYKGEDTNSYDYGTAVQQRRAQAQEMKVFESSVIKGVRPALDAVRQEYGLSEEQWKSVVDEAIASELLVYQRDPGSGQLMPATSQIEHSVKIHRMAVGSLMAKGKLSSSGERKAKDTAKKVLSQKEREAARIKAKFAKHGSAPGGGGAGRETRPAPKQRKGESDDEFMQRQLRENPRLRKAAKSANLRIN
jgi:hypothetical protein